MLYISLNYVPSAVQSLIVGEARDIEFIEIPLTQLRGNNYSFAYDPKHAFLNYNYGCSLTDLEV